MGSDFAIVLQLPKTRGQEVADEWAWRLSRMPGSITCDQTVTCPHPVSPHT